MSTAKTRKDTGNAVFIGVESFLVEEELRRLKGQLAEGASMNWSVFNAEEGPGVDEIIHLSNTMPFLADRRVIVVRNSQRLSAKHLDLVAAYLDNPCESTTFILVFEVEKADKEFMKLLARFDGKAEFTRFEPLKNRNDRIAWISGRARIHGKNMDKDAAVLLSDMTGSSMWYLDSEVQKLCLYIGERPTITAGDIQDVVMRTHEPAIFAFLDSLFDRKKDVLSILYDLELSGVNDLEIISRIANQAITHYVVLTGGDRKRMKIHDFVAEKALRRKSLWSGIQLTTLLKEVRAIEQRLKSGQLAHTYAALCEVIGRTVLTPKGEPRKALRP